jgi:hypothetical protein
VLNPSKTIGPGSGRWSVLPGRDGGAYIESGSGVQSKVLLASGILAGTRSRM